MMAASVCQSHGSTALTLYEEKIGLREITFLSSTILLISHPLDRMGLLRAAVDGENVGDFGEVCKYVNLLKVFLKRKRGKLTSPKAATLHSTH